MEYHWGPVALRADVERGCWSVAHHTVVLSTGADGYLEEGLYVLCLRPLILRGSAAGVLGCAGAGRQESGLGWTGTPCTSAGEGGPANLERNDVFHIALSEGEH